MFDLTRFKKAQEREPSGFKTALSEIRAGHKRSHWIWYIFPQLAGLGSSGPAQAYGILCVTNDFIWWVPFGLYLYDAWPFFKKEWRRAPEA
jgi:uncharacterized protein (DUF1810 family)